MIRHQQANPLSLQLINDFLDVCNRNRIDPGERLVEQDERRGDHQGPRDLGASPLLPGEVVGAAFGQVADLELLQDRGRALVDLLPWHVERLQDGDQVLLHRHLAEYRRLLRQVAQAAARAEVHRQAGHVLPAEQHPPGVRTHEADDAVERRGLAGAVRPEEPDHFPTLDVEGNVLDDGPPAVALGQPLNGEFSAQRRERPCVRVSA